MDGPDPFSSSRRTGWAKARRAAMAEAPDRGPDAMDMEEKDPKGAHGVRWVAAACGARNAACGAL